MEPFDLYSPLIDADPFPYYAKLRENHPCYWSDGAQLFMAVWHVRGIALLVLQCNTLVRELFAFKQLIIWFLRVSMSGITNDRSCATVTHP